MHSGPGQARAFLAAARVRAGVVAWVLLGTLGAGAPVAFAQVPAASLIEIERGFELGVEAGSDARWGAVVGLELEARRPGSTRYFWVSGNLLSAPGEGEGPVALELSVTPLGGQRDLLVRGPWTVELGWQLVPISFRRDLRLDLDAMGSIGLTALAVGVRGEIPAGDAVPALRAFAELSATLLGWSFTTLTGPGRDTRSWDHLEPGASAGFEIEWRAGARLRFEADGTRPLLASSSYVPAAAPAVPNGGTFIYVDTQRLSLAFRAASREIEAYLERRELRQRTDDGADGIARSRRAVRLGARVAF